MTTYAERVAAIIQAHYTHPSPDTIGCDSDRGILNYATAALWLNQNVADANAKLAAVRIDNVTGKNCGSVDPGRLNLWLGYLIRPYGLFGPGSRFFPGRMTTAAANNLETQMWVFAHPYSKMTYVDGPWDIYDSENHDACAKSFYLLAAQMCKNRYPARVYGDSSTPAQQYAAWRNHWSNWFDERAKRGLFVEAGSPTYLGYTLQAVLNIYQFAEDAVLRKKAEMFLDLCFADYAQQQLGNVRGGAKSRSYPLESYDGVGDDLTNAGALLFGGAPHRSNHSLALATSRYQPPPVVATIATDVQGRGSFEIVNRRPGVGPSGWDA